MSTSYWDYWRTDITRSTATTSSSNIDLDTSCAGTGWTSTSWHYVEYFKPRKILVSIPKKWTEEQGMKFVELVNIKTKTGWIVTLVIRGGDIVITDPDVERRTMAEFVPLLLKKAYNEDAILIKEFFNDNPI